MSHLIKVTFEYSDGTKKYLDLEELDKWMAFNAIIAQNAENHNCNPPWNDIKWRIDDGKPCKY